MESSHLLDCYVGLTTASRHTSSSRGSGILFTVLAVLLLVSLDLVFTLITYILQLRKYLLFSTTLPVEGQYMMLKPAQIIILIALIAKALPVSRFLLKILPQPSDSNRNSCDRLESMGALFRKSEDLHIPRSLLDLRFLYGRGSLSARTNIFLVFSVGYWSTVIYFIFLGGIDSSTT